MRTLEGNNLRFQRQLEDFTEALGLNTEQAVFLNQNRVAAIRLMAVREFDARLDSDFVLQAVDNLMENLEVNLTDRYLSTATSDIAASNLMTRAAFVNIQDPMFLEDCTEIKLSFGITDSDQLDADQPVHPLLIEALQFAIDEANKVLETLRYPLLIESVHISATTNGLHGPNSNHYAGTAIDISRINGTRMLEASGDERRLIFELQQAFNTYPHIRENFGPFMKYKYTLENTRWNYQHEVSGHRDHIHISVRR